MALRGRFAALISTALVGTALAVLPVSPSLATPELGKFVDASLVSGTVLIKTPGAAGYEPLGPEEQRQIPVGSLVDTRGGRVHISAANPGQELSSVDFGEGIAKVTQDTSGLVTLTLTGGSSAKCRSADRAGNSKVKVIRELEAVAKGRFRTRGRYSAATVRGTNWIVADRCDGTLTKVKRGKVLVRDFRLKRSVLLGRGKSYLAKAP
jgi:hypothetical protein